MALNNPLNDPSTIGLGALIKSQRFQIPKHQRDFKWDDELIRQFFTDIEEAMDRGEDSYFVGLMVFQNSPDGDLIVLDGQQRITTCLLLFSAIRNWLSECISQDIKNEAIKVEEWFLGASELGQTTPSPKLTLNAMNNPDFVKYVVGKEQTSESLDKEIKALSAKHRRRHLLLGVRSAKSIVSGKASDFKSEEAAANFFYSFVGFLRDKVRVVSLTVPTDGAAYSIFETLNDRGLTLAPLDLIKNLVFSRIDGNKNFKLDHAQDRWTEMLALLQNVDPNKFIRVFWLANHDLVQGPKIFSEFKETYKTASAANEASKSLRTAAEYYAGLSNPDDPIWSTHTNKTRRILSSLNVIGATQVHPVLLAMLQKQFAATQLEDTVRALETVLVRYQLVGTGRPGTLERLGAKVAKQITDGKITRPAQIRAAYKEIMTSDEEFTSAFSRFSEPTASKCHYLLARIEAHEKSRAGGEVEQIPENATVEHIMPKRPGSEWDEVMGNDKDILEDCLHRLGNLCLLSKDRLGNSGFEAKSKEYAKSSYEITKRVSQFNTYSRDLVDVRQREMAKAAKAIWRFPD